MNFFGHSTGGSRIALTSDLWIFVASVVPLSIVVFTVWALWVHIATTKWMHSVSAAQQIIPKQPPDHTLDVNHALPDVRADLADGPIYCFRG
jgi:hypothetical protein